uniref:Uncharacterized protein n=1 Tax=Pyrodinium bahamense TaxID=73915 RepID=A0A7S0FXS8_9DINO
MPIFEEKLICPLSVRFTQDHIRPVFQDGHELGAAVAEITTRPGTGDYDVILEAPFPSIEVVGWRQREGGAREEPENKHWVTLDNRRLYCLQRAAAALWPRRAAVVVEVLYAATECILRKCDSSTAGRSVGIGHSPKALTGWWDWREVVTTNGPEAAAAWTLVAADGRKTRMEELVDAPAPPSMLDLFLQGADISRSQLKASTDSGSEDSTTMPSSPRSHHSSSEHSADALAEALVGRWKTYAGEVYEIRASGQGCWVCCRAGGSKGASQRFTLKYDMPTSAIWWGNLNLCVDAAEVCRDKGHVRWYATSDNWRRQERFLWQRSEDAQARADKPRRRRAKGTEEPTAAMANAAEARAEPAPPDGAPQRHAPPQRAQRHAPPRGPRRSSAGR